MREIYEILWLVTERCAAVLSRLLYSCLMNVRMVILRVFRCGHYKYVFVREVREQNDANVIG